MEHKGQKRVEPIRRKKDWENIIYYLYQKKRAATTDSKYKKATRNLFLFEFGVNMALRISDLLELKVKDIQNNSIYIIDKKTRKSNKFPLNKKAISVYQTYVQELELDPEQYLFTNFRKGNEHMTTRNATFIFKDIQENVLDNKFRINTHTLRKTYGYQFYKATNDAETLRRILNHANIETTQKYIGMLDDDVDKARASIEIF